MKVDVLCIKSVNVTRQNIIIGNNCMYTPVILRAVLKAKFLAIKCKRHDKKLVYLEHF